VVTHRYDSLTLPAGWDKAAETAVVEAYGARLAVSAPDAVTLQAILEGLPTGWSVAPADTRHDDVSWRFGVLGDERGYRVIQGNGEQQDCADLELAIWLMRTQMRRYVGHHSQSLIFVHAGVVAHQGRALLLPGHSFAGKSTLVAALVRAGAEYYSDEFALLDDGGRVSQYREPIQLRGPNGRELLTIDSDRPRDPVPVGVVAITVYMPGASWSPRRLSTGEGVVALMEHASPAREKPAETLATLRRALEGAVILSGERGGADATAQLLMQALAANQGS
jgi:hypothetical protein